MIVTKTVVKSKAVAELMVGDRLMQDIMGYKNRVIYNQGKTLSARDIAWFREKLKENPPKLASERYQTGKRAIIGIKNAAGQVLVKPGDPITAEAMAPLLKEGFTVQDGLEGGIKVFVRPQVWPADRPYRIDQMNQLVRVETIVTINDEVQSEPEVVAAGAAPTRTGGGEPALAASAQAQAPAKPVKFTK